ncbi:MAG: single-stranded-DNA-specific exonuclease RecJ [Candidatus Pacebacteria bacterium]|nr:single-stranded-DNA-specific exonuclease RecJ [Candidatus Paceibacterota bacterium]MDD5357290.1 single-stranded-DNA-specific exonuclease RecJ [Candidatus Paceibacterota bacterium]
MKSYSTRACLPKDAEKELEAFPELTRHLLFHRGIQNGEDAKTFLNPDYISHVHDPFLLSGMEKAVQRILKAIEKKEKICIYSDYDMDGIPGAIVLSDFFKRIGYKENIRVYIPHRHDEGFGLNHDAIEDIAKEGAKLLITIDCGIADPKEVAHANSLGLDVIVTDHHLPGKILPEAFAIINPKCSPEYPFQDLCGSGVVFKLVQALLLKNDFGLKEGTEKWLLDMVGMATCSDMVPLVGENRVFAQYGLKVLRKSPRVGLVKFFAKNRVNQRDLTEDDIGFTIAPRINAASRMGDPMQAFRLLSTDDEAEADELSDYLNQVNDERKGVVASMVKEMKRKISERFAKKEMPKVLVMGNPLWRPSLLGLAANTLMEAHSRPVFLWGRDGGDGEGALKGSCRSDGSVSLVGLMQATRPGVFAEFGGHHMAGGFTVISDKVHFLEEELEHAYEKAREAYEKPDALVADKKLLLEDVNWQTYGEIEKLAPFGVGNAKPVFLFDKVAIEEVKQFGKEKNHLELIFRKADGRKVSAISFFSSLKDFEVPIEKGSSVNLVASMEKSTFRNFPELRLRIIDIV